MPRNFLFVNKDPSSSSLTRSSITEQTSINSHVQRGRRHIRSAHVSGRRRLAAPLKDDDSDKEKSPDNESSASASASASSPSSSSTSSSNSVPIRNSPPGFSTFVENQELPSVPQPPYYTSDRLDHDAVARIRTAQQTSDDLISIATPNPRDDSDNQLESPLTPPTSVGGSPHDISQIAFNSVDPFQTSSVKLDFKSHQLIQYYQRVYHPAVWHAETRASAKGTYAFQTSATEVIQSALASDVDMYALLACMASRLEHIDRQPGQGTDEYLGKALAATRRVLMERAKFEPKPNEEILMIIFHLYAAEGYRNNAAAAKIHMRGAKTIVQSIGGLAKLRDPQMRELLITGDGLLSAMTLQPCELPCEFDPGAYLVATRPELRFNTPLDLTYIAPALRNRPATSLIPAEMDRLIDETAEIQWVLQNAKDGAPNASQHAMRWLQIRNMAVRHRLLELELPDHRLDAFRAALVLWIVTTTTLLGQQRLGARIAPQLRLKLEKAALSGQVWETDVNAKAWILSLGAMCAISGSLDETWFITGLKSLITASLIASTLQDEDRMLSNLQGLQQQFFYHDTVFGPRLQNLVSKLTLRTSSTFSDGPG